MAESTPDRVGSRFQLETELARDLGLVAATTIIVGGIIGSGIFGAPAGIAAVLGSPELFPAGLGHRRACSASRVRCASPNWAP